MKLNWGHYILITFSVFVLLILYMVFRSFDMKHELVSEDYYAKELKFQNVIDGQKLANDLTENITWASKNGSIVISYPELDSPITGEILLMRPSDKAMDLNIPIELNEQRNQFVSNEDLSLGKYLIQITWYVDEKEYYTEGVVHVNQ